mmetsp:Transcript_42684/g.115110  ORF Transcript_42684/g.115110 Transcript_42684/m.115110 type:complete len:158 (-) Transcript_42684:147-620(-)
MAAETPEKCMRSSSEYVKSPAQQASKYLAQQALKMPQAAEQIDAKQFLQQKEAQGLIDIFRERIEATLDEDFSEWTVVDYQGDMRRKAIAKVRTGSDEYVHVFALRLARIEPWSCRYAANKSQGDELETSEDDYDSLPDGNDRCSTIDGSCNVCSLM